MNTNKGDATSRDPAPASAKARRNAGFLSGLSRATLLLALASLLSDISTEMLYPVLPIFLTQVLGASVGVVGMIEGVATATQYVSQGLSGWLADRWQRAKTFALVGYTLAAVAKASIGLATVWPVAFVARVVDRFFTGMRSAPRDALIAASTNAEHSGKAFGLEGLGDNLGAFLGPLLSVALLFGLHVSMRVIFFLVIIPGLLAALVIVPITMSRAPVDPPAPSPATPARAHRLLESLREQAGRFPAAYWKYLGITALFGLGNSTTAFLILRTRQIGISVELTILIYAGFNLVAALASYPAGALSDAVGRSRMLLFALVVFVLTYAGFALAPNTALIAVLFVLYGLHTGMYRAAGKALATDLCPSALRATGIGWYATTLGIGELLASIIAGQLWTRLTPSAAFIYGALLCSLAILGLLVLRPAASPRSPEPIPSA